MGADQVPVVRRVLDLGGRDSSAMQFVSLGFFSVGWACEGEHAQVFVDFLEAGLEFPKHPVLFLDLQSHLLRALVADTVNLDDFKVLFAQILDLRLVVVAELHITDHAGQRVIAAAEGIDSLAVALGSVGAGILDFQKFAHLDELWFLCENGCWDFEASDMWWEMDA